MLAGVLLLLPLLCQAQKNLFNTYSDMKGVSSVYISKAMIEMNPRLFTKDIYIGRVSGKLNSVQILSTMDNNIKKSMRKDIQTLIHSSKYELLMKQKGIVSSSEFYVSRKGDKVSELVMVIDGAASLKFVYLDGEMTLSDIQSIMKYQNTSMNDENSWVSPLIEGSVGIANLACVKSLESLKSLKGLDDLADLKDLESMKNLKNLKNLEGVDIKMNSKDWKEFEKQMSALGEQMGAWGEELGEAIDKSLDD